MIKFVCDACAKTKRTGQNWILGLAAETVGITSTRREVNILSDWVEPQTVHPLAVHFCSERCKDKYTRRLVQAEAAA